MSGWLLWEPWWWSALMILVIWAQWYRWRRRLRWGYLTILGLAAISLVLHLSMIATAASAGCYPWSPKRVTFHQGMNLCPGQTVVESIEE